MRPGLDGSIKSKGEGAIGSPRGGILVCAGPVRVHPHARKFRQRCTEFDGL